MDLGLCVSVVSVCLCVCVCLCLSVFCACDRVWICADAADGDVTPGPLPQPIYLNVPTWAVAVVGVVVVVTIVALKACDFRCVLTSPMTDPRRSWRRCVIARRLRPSGDRPTSYMALAAVFQAAVRLMFSFVITTRMYYVDTAKWTFLWIHLATVGVAVGVGAGVVVAFFRRLSRGGGGGKSASGGATAGPALAAWNANHATLIRVVKMVAVVKPGVLQVLQSGVSPAFEIPVEPWHPGWRYVGGCSVPFHSGWRVDTREGLCTVDRVVAPLFHVGMCCAAYQNCIVWRRRRHVCRGHDTSSSAGAVVSQV